MAIRHYRDLVLVLEVAAQDRRGAVSKVAVQVFDSPVGQGELKETINLPGDLRRQLRWLEGRALDQEPQRQYDLGEALAALLLPPYARRLFGESLRRLGEDEGLRLRLRLAEELADFPWEYLYVREARGERSASGFLLLDPRLSLVRHEALPVPGDWFETPSRRRIVIAMASPEPYAEYPRLEHLAAERRAIRQALDPAAGLEAVFVPEYAEGDQAEPPSANLKQLMAALVQHTDVFHFSGHGQFVGEMGPTLESTVGEGSIVLADARNQALSVSAERLAEVLRSKGVRLVVLGACETGRRDGHNVWSGVAAALLKAGIPAVVAMQYTIEDGLAAAFSAALYRALAVGLTIDEAVSLGRAAIRAEAIDGRPHVRDWGVPVLYLRAPGGVVFNPIRDVRARREAESQLEQLVQQRVRRVSKRGRLVGARIEAMAVGAVKVEQKVTEEANGFVLGATTFGLEGGRLTVRQEADVVSGTMVGARIGRLGGGAPADAAEEQALAALEKLLRLESP